MLLRASSFAPRRGDVAVPAALAALLLLAVTHVIAPAGRHVDTDIPAGRIAGWYTEHQAQFRTGEEEHETRRRGKSGETLEGHNAARDQGRTGRPQRDREIVRARV